MHRRRSIRLKHYDYAQAGAYFVTICTHQRGCLFGAAANGAVRLNEYGCIAGDAWGELPGHYGYLALDAFVVMPNHVHGILVLPSDDVPVVGAGFKPAPTKSDPMTNTPAPAMRRHGLPEIVRAFKTFSARRVNKIRQTPGVPVWQRGYYEHIIRDDESLRRIREYIWNNPAQWENDEENPWMVDRDRAEFPGQ